MEDQSSLISYCGLYCGACSFKLTYDENNREHVSAMITELPEKYSDCADEPIDEFLCYGCRDEQSTDKDGCSIYRCVTKKGLAHCGLWDEFPCSDIVSTDDDTQPHHTGMIENLKMLRDHGEEHWLRKQEKYWACECGAKRSWYFKTCLNCSKSITIENT